VRDSVTTEATTYQTELMCHDLGISGDNLHSYRNFFAASPGSLDFFEWLTLVQMGHAIDQDSAKRFSAS
jgi:hypothetical protein